MESDFISLLPTLATELVIDILVDQRSECSRHCVFTQEDVEIHLDIRKVVKTKENKNGTTEERYD